MSSANRAQVQVGENAVAVLEGCRAYLKECVRFLTDEQEALPDSSLLIEARLPQSTILEARADGADRFARNSPFIAAVVQDRLEPNERRNERYFDPWYFATMILMEIPGGRFHFDRSKRGKYFFLAYIGPKKIDGNHYLRRIISNTPWWADTREEGTNKGYDYRRAALRWVAKESVIDDLGQPSRWRSRTREDAIRFAVALFRSKLGGRRKMPEIGLSAAEYGNLLGLAFDIADAMHARAALPKAQATEAAA